MTQDNVVNATLLSAGILVLSQVPSAFQINFWYGIVGAIVGVAIIAVREVLP